MCIVPHLWGIENDLLVDVLGSFYRYLLPIKYMQEVLAKSINYIFV